MKVIRLYRNKKTGDIYQDLTITNTLFNQFSEDDFIIFSSLIYFIKEVETKPDEMKIKIDGDNSENALSIFSSKAQSWIKTKKSDQNYIDLKDFNGINPSLSTKNFENEINLISKEKLDKLRNYGKSTGFLTKNLLVISRIKDSKIQLDYLIKELSKLYLEQHPNITDRSLEDYQYWRNKIIKNTTRNFILKRINRDFLSFLLLHIFKYIEEYLEIIDYEELFDGKKIKS